MLEKMETDERCVEEKCKDAQNFSHQLTIASLLSSSLSSGGVFIREGSAGQFIS